MQTPATQVWPEVQAWPQLLQLFWSACVLVHTVEQRVVPVGQPPHDDATQVWRALYSSETGEATRENAAMKKLAAQFTSAT